MQQCSPPVSSNPEAEREKRRAALASVLWALFLTAVKLAAGLASDSLGILSEALHSCLDLVAAGITLFAVRVASRPADKRHPYGYGKVENLSALAETALLLAACGWIAREAAERLLYGTSQVVPSLWGLGAIGISLLVDIRRARMLRRAAQKYRSQALEADALHFTTDIWSSGTVLVGLACVWASSFFPPQSTPARALVTADAIAALAVCGIVVSTVIGLSRRAVTALMDGGSPERTEAVEHALATRLPKYDVRRLRIRESGADAFVDLTVLVPASLNLEAAHDIAHEVEAVVRDVLPAADVTVHVEPRTEHNASILQIARTAAAKHDLGIHNLVLSTRGEQLAVYLHVEAPPRMTLSEAHAEVEAYEATFAERLERAGLAGACISTHIEPDDRLETNLTPVDAPDAQRVRQRVEELLQAFPQVRELHDLKLEHAGGSALLSFHCRIPGDMTVARAHDLSTKMERVLRRELPELGQILIHTDPLPEVPQSGRKTKHILREDGPGSPLQDDTLSRRHTVE